MTVDLELADPNAPWPFEHEEYAVCCVVDGAPWCTTEAIGSSLLMLHRFGGTYGPVRFALHVGWSRPRTPLRLILLTGGGIPFHVQDLAVQRDRAAADLLTTKKANVKSLYSSGFRPGVLHETKRMIKVWPET